MKEALEFASVKLHVAGRHDEKGPLGPCNRHRFGNARRDDPDFAGGELDSGARAGKAVNAVRKAPVFEPEGGSFKRQF